MNDPFAPVTDQERQAVTQAWTDFSERIGDEISRDQAMNFAGGPDGFAELNREFCAAVPDAERHTFQSMLDNPRTRCAGIDAMRTAIQVAKLRRSTPFMF